MKLIVELDFFADGMDEDNPEEVRDYIQTVIEDGASVTCTTVSVDGIHFEKNCTVVPKEELQGYYNDSEKLGALEAAGVDNWSGYGDAMQMLKEGLEEY